MFQTASGSSLPAQPRTASHRVGTCLSSVTLALALGLATTTLPALPAATMAAPAIRLDEPSSPGSALVVESGEALGGDTSGDLGPPSGGSLQVSAGQGPAPHAEGPAEPAGILKQSLGDQVPPALQLDPKAWTKLDVGLATAFWVTFVTDWIQTRQIAKAQYTCSDVKQYWVGSCLNTVPAQTGMYREANPLLGGRPSMRKVNLYFATTGLGSAFLMNALPTKWRRAFLLAGVSLEAYVVQDNAKAGLRIRY